MLVNFNDDLPGAREYIAERVRAQAAIVKPVCAIEVGFQLCQAGLLLYHFDTRGAHKRDGHWTLSLSGPTLELPHWREAYASAEDVVGQSARDHPD